MYTHWFSLTGFFCKWKPFPLKKWVVQFLSYFQHAVGVQFPGKSVHYTWDSTLVPFCDSSPSCPSEHWDFVCYTWDTTFVPFWDFFHPCPSEHEDFVCYTAYTTLVPFWDFSPPCPSEHWDFGFFSWLEFSWALVEGPLWYQTRHHHNHLQCHHQWELW